MTFYNLSSIRTMRKKYCLRVCLKGIQFAILLSLVSYVIILSSSQSFEDMVRGAMNGSEHSHESDHSMVLVTAAHETNFRAVQNLIGSIHFWSPRRQIVIFDVGLNDAQRDMIMAWCHVSLLWRSMPNNLLPHFYDLDNPSWKYLCVKKAVDMYGTILWIDPGSDVRSPIDVIETILKRDGYFFIKNGENNVADHSHFETLQQFGVGSMDLSLRPILSDDLQGFVRGSQAYTSILIPLLDCVTNTLCMIPGEANSKNHHSVLSVAAAAASNIELKTHTKLVSFERKDFPSQPEMVHGILVYIASRKSNEYWNKVKNCTVKAEHKQEV
ncbi:unnamed protein product [Owenia fusiformis]|uniref:Uncharacterized protein n=1 Tax=Owenia fusiformis TaxID=6347 RepID=A0A8J1XM28_OWEFU|nr:unnamed protein product [Owenia fusiformis]